MHPGQSRWPPAGAQATAASAWAGTAAQAAGASGAPAAVSQPSAAAQPSEAAGDPLPARSTVGPRRLAIHLDDLGLHEGVWRAASRLHALGRLQGASAMVGAPAWPAAARAWAGMPAGTVELGLHLDLTEHPLTLPPRGLPQCIAAAWAHAFDTAGLRREVAAQLDAFAHSVGRPPQSVDGHQHVHQLPQVRDVLLEELDRRGWQPWLRDTRPPAGLRGAPRAKARLIAALGSAGLRARVAAGGRRQNRHLLGVYGFDADAQAHARRLHAWLRACGDGDQLMVHAADASASPADALGPARQMELDQLLEPWFGEALVQHGVVLAPIGATVGATVGTTIGATFPPGLR